MQRARAPYLSAECHRNRVFVNSELIVDSNTPLCSRTSATMSDATSDCRHRHDDMTQLRASCSDAERRRDRRPRDFELRQRRDRCDQLSVVGHNAYGCADVSRLFECARFDVRVFNSVYTAVANVIAEFSCICIERSWDRRPAPQGVSSEVSLGWSMPASATTPPLLLTPYSRMISVVDAIA